MSNVSVDERALAGRRCLVTGAAGFLGRRVVARLRDRGVRVTAQVRTRTAASAATETLCGDLTETSFADELRREWRWDDLVHLAGPVSAAAVFTEEAQVVRAHVRIATGMARAIPPEWPGRVVHASSMTVYGAAPTLPVPEAQPLTPRFPYALAKVLAEDVWRAFAHSDLWLLRFAGLFSEERRSGALFHFVRAGVAGLPIRISAPEPTLWDVLHVDDAAEAVVRALAHPRPFCGAMNVSYGEVVEIEQVARRVAVLTGGVPVIHEPRIEHPPFQLDISLASSLLRWPPCSLQVRLEELVRHIKESGV